MTDSALVILSGGQDSTFVLGWASKHFEEVHALTFDYGQRHSVEIESAINVANFYEARTHEVLELGQVLRSASPLVSDNELEQYENYEQMARLTEGRVENTFVPMRNALFLTLAANRAAHLGVFNIATGVCQADYAGYFDCRQAFISAQEAAINQALGLTPDTTSMKMSIHVPLMNLTKDESVRLALGVPGVYQAWSFSHTAYDGQYPPVGHDHATLLRAEGFRKAGLPDPLVVRAYLEEVMDLPETENYNVVREKKPKSIEELCEIVGAEL